MPIESPYYGKALPEAAMHRLALIGKPETPRRIWEALSNEGFPSTAKDPGGAVHWALKRRAEKFGDVLLVGVGKWGLRSWYTSERVEEINRNLGGMGGRDREVHVEKTKRAIESLKARGVRWGRPSSVTGEQMAIFVRARQQGKTKAEASREVVLPQTYKDHSNRYELDDWKPGDPWPPPSKAENRSETQTAKPHLRVVGES